MKKIIFLLFIIIFTLFSCEKEEINPYRDGGVLPSDTSNSDEDDTNLEGTTWVLLYFQKGFASEKPNDTITFGKFNYSLNYKKYDQYAYILSETMDLGNPYDLRLYGFSPFGDNGIWETTLVNTFIIEGEINLSEFENPSSQSTTKIKATFKRIQ